MLSEELGKEDDDFNTEMVDAVVYRMAPLREDSIFYQAYETVGEEEQNYRTALGNAFAMEFLYCWWPPQTEVLVSAGAKVKLEEKLEELKTRKNYDKLKLVKIIERV
eukprot:GHVS01097029.1.p2 GENE.GHVS01097029.1~~GHVS01097029.1.p2  ORF type:complete len:107 (-),score=16.22 GHVS01097029.1:51-371(-)